MARRKEKVSTAPGHGALPRARKEVPEHIRRAADRAEARADGRPLPKPEGPVPEAVRATEAARRRAKAASKKAKASPAVEPAEGDEVPDDEDATARRDAARALRGAFDAGVEAGRERHAGGRPQDYLPEYADRVRAMQGAVTTFDIAQELQVTERTIYRWKRIHTEFCQAITDKREQFDDEIEHSLAERAKGYYYEDTHISAFQGSVTLTPIVKHMPGDVSAQKHWLANRRPDKWRNDADSKPPADTMTPQDRNAIDAARKIMAALEIAMSIKAKPSTIINASAVDAEVVNG